MRWPLAGILIALWTPVSVPVGALAAPLDEEACKSVKTEREALIAKGVDGDLARGPEWAKANLKPDRLQEVARLIELNEQLTFRCGQMTVARPDGKPLLKKEPPPPKAAEPAGAAGEPGAKPAKKKKKAASKSSDAGAAPAQPAPPSAKTP